MLNLKETNGFEHFFFQIFLSIITENPLDQSSINTDYPSDNLQLSPSRNDNIQNVNGMKSPPPFYSKRFTRKLPKMSKLKFLPKRKSYNTITFDRSKPVTPFYVYLLIQVSLKTPTPIHRTLYHLKPSSGNTCQDIF